MKISFCVIAKDDKDLSNLKRLIESAKPAIDKVHITLNHEPYSKVKAWCKKNNYDFSYLKWNDDFAEQRNFNFSRIDKDTDYVMWADSDDVIVNAHLIRDVAQISKTKGHDTVFFTYYYASEFDGEPSVETFIKEEITQMRERLMRPGSIVWKKRIHETPIPLDGVNHSYTQVKYSEKYPILWLHLGADRDLPPEKLKERTARNQRMLELELEDEKKEGQPDPRTLLYLMKIYAESDEEETLMECLEMGKEYLARSGWDEERALCCKMMAVCMGKLGDDEGARDFLYDAIKEYPKSILLYLHLARVYYNLKDYSSMKHWMDVAMGMDVEPMSNASMSNLLEVKAISAELLLKYSYWVERDIHKSVKAAKMLNKIDPTPEHKENVDFLEEKERLDDVSKNSHEVMKYFENVRKEERIPRFIRTLPKEVQELPFARRYYARFKEPRIWKSNEICYFANFGKEHFEKWDGESIRKGGIGGSETAVIRLSEEWTKLGYSVVVYGDPKEPIMVNGVLYLPFYDFSQRDKFNIFIQWRHNSLAGKISAKKFLVDLHDVTDSATYIHKVDQIDKIMVKSKYHRNLLDKIPDDKFLIVGNGI